MRWYLIFALLAGAAVASAQSNHVIETDVTATDAYSSYGPVETNLALYYEAESFDTGEFEGRYRIYVTQAEKAAGLAALSASTKSNSIVKAEAYRDGTTEKANGGFESLVEEFGVALATNGTRWVICVDTNGTLFTVLYSASPPKPKSERRSAALAKEKRIQGYMDAIDPSQGSPSHRALIRLVGELLNNPAFTNAP